jgi:hypothetical protein
LDDSLPMNSARQQQPADGSSSPRSLGFFSRMKVSSTSWAKPVC